MVNIRQASLDDLDMLVQLRVALLVEIGDIKNVAGEKSAKEANRAYITESIQKGDFLSWVAEIDGKIVSTSGLTFWKKPPTYKSSTGLEAYIMNMYTLPEWRRNGIATMLLREIISFVKTTGVKRIWLHATTGGKPIYEKEQFIVPANDLELTEMELILK
jgi:GNAT superfamily N-acetyltransferase